MNGRLGKHSRQKDGISQFKTTYLVSTVILHVIIGAVLTDNPLLPVGLPAGKAENVLSLYGSAQMRRARRERRPSIARPMAFFKGEI